MSAMPEISSRQQCYQRLLSNSQGFRNSPWLSQMVSSWLEGEGVLPDLLGLSASQFNRLRARCFPDYALDRHAVSGSKLDFSRMLEKQDLEQLLRQFAAYPDEESEWLISMIVAACLGNDHLWQDLGLWSRNELSALMQTNFPELSARNNKDMKWKKFLYKQLCEAEGIYICRAPSCEVCQDYGNCFGEER